MSDGDYTVEQILSAISKALAAHDIGAVVGLLGMLAVRDPEAAQSFIDLVAVANKIGLEA